MTKPQRFRLEAHATREAVRALVIGRDVGGGERQPGKNSDVKQ